MSALHAFIMMISVIGIATAVGLVVASIDDTKNRWKDQP